MQNSAKDHNPGLKSDEGERTDTFQKSEKSFFAEKAKANQLSGLKQNSTVSQISVERIDTQKELAKVAGVSR